MLNQLTLILCCQLAGEMTAKFLALPAPGPVLGMVLLLAILIVKGGIGPQLERTATAFLDNLSLLFVPAAVGVMLHYELLSKDWLPISVALIVSTIATIAVTGLMMSWLSGIGGRKSDGPTAQSSNKDDQ